jgi:hypothetical protein
LPQQADVVLMCAVAWPQIIARELRESRRTRGRHAGLGAGAAGLRCNAVVTPHYLVHYKGWSNRYDEWVDEGQILDDTDLETMHTAVRVAEGPDRGDESTSGSDSEGDGGERQRPVQVHVHTQARPPSRLRKGARSKASNGADVEHEVPAPAPAPGPVPGPGPGDGSADVKGEPHPPAPAEGMGF